jgi:hypothetical protein
VSHHDEKVADVEFGPDGLEFKEEVLLEIEYSGTASDPLAADYHGRPPALFYHNPATKAWEEVPTKVDLEQKRLVARLRHFSRYAMFEPTQEGEWQWTAQGGSIPPLRSGDDVASH